MYNGGATDYQIVSGGQDWVYQPSFDYGYLSMFLDQLQSFGKKFRFKNSVQR